MIREAKMLEHQEDGVMFHCVKSFGKVQFQDYNFLLCLMALVNIFNAPGKAVLDSSRSDKTILIGMEQL